MLDNKELIIITNREINLKSDKIKYIEHVYGNRKLGSAKCSFCQLWKSNTYHNFSDNELSKDGNNRLCEDCLKIKNKLKI